MRVWSRKTRRYVEPGQDDLVAAVERLVGGEDGVLPDWWFSMLLERVMNCSPVYDVG
jgi:hypothetical protein